MAIIGTETLQQYVGVYKQTTAADGTKTHSASKQMCNRVYRIKNIVKISILSYPF